MQKGKNKRKELLDVKNCILDLERQTTSDENSALNKDHLEQQLDAKTAELEQMTVNKTKVPS